MRPLFGVSSRDANYNPFTSYREHEHFFRLNNTSHVSHTVQCVRGRTMLIVPDCGEAKAQGDLVFFNDKQPNYLKSLVACYIGQVRGQDGAVREAALVIDTDVAGFFKQEDAQSFKFIIEEFSARLALELSLLALTTGRKKAPNDHPVRPHTTGTGKEGEATATPPESSTAGDET
jgi:hypothetical protein